MKIWRLIQRNVESVEYPIEALYIDLPLLLTHDPRPDLSQATDVAQADQLAQDDTPNDQCIEQSVPDKILQKIESIDGVDVEQVNRQLRGNETDQNFV